MAIGGSDGTGKGGSAGGNGIGGSGTGSGGKVGTGGAGAGGSTLTPAHLTIAGSGGVPASAVIADTVTATFAITNNGQQTSGALTYALDGDPNFYYGRDPVNPCTSGVTTLGAGEVCLVPVAVSAGGSRAGDGAALDDVGRQQHDHVYRMDRQRNGSTVRQRSHVLDPPPRCH